MIHVAGTDWPEVQIADFVAFFYHREFQSIANNRITGTYLELVKVTNTLHRRRFSRAMTVGWAEFVETNLSGVGLEVAWGVGRPQASDVFSSTMERWGDRLVERARRGELDS